MLGIIDNFLNRITMYRLMLYFLCAIWLNALILSFLGILPFTWWQLVYSTVIITLVALISNKIFSNIFRVPANGESDYITTLILVFLITPGSPILFLVLAPLLAMASKYFLAIWGKHIFNPAAISVVATTYLISQSASWWVGVNYLV